MPLSVDAWESGIEYKTLRHRVLEFLGKNSDLAFDMKEIAHETALDYEVSQVAHTLETLVAEGKVEGRVIQMGGPFKVYFRIAAK